jgi:hypothetical protein
VVHFKNQLTLGELITFATTIILAFFVSIRWRTKVSRQLKKKVPKIGRELPGLRFLVSEFLIDCGHRSGRRAGPCSSERQAHGFDVACGVAGISRAAGGSGGRDFRLDILSSAGSINGLLKT